MERKRITFSMPMDLYLLLKAEAENTGTQVASMLNIAVKEYLKQNSIMKLTSLYEEELKKSRLEEQN